MEQQTVIKPYNKTEGKKEQVEEMFNNIASNYDFLNHFLSFGIDNIWRKKAIKFVTEKKPDTIIDVATGTADLAIATSKKLPGVAITGVDISGEMLAIGKEKIIKEGLNDAIHLQIGDGEHLEFPTAFFNAAMVAFGVRNFENLEKGLKEISRVLDKKGRLVILEFSKPKNPLFARIYSFYFNKILPGFGKMISKDHRAYSYLPESVNHFPEDDKLISLLKESGFQIIKIKKLTGGVASLYICDK